MRKFFGFIVLTLCILIYVVSCNEKLTKKLYTYKSNSIPVFQSDKWQNGDLYGMSYLPFFRRHNKVYDTVPRIVCNRTNKINLYAICDSYLWGFFASDKFYCNVNEFTLVKTNDKGCLKTNLDPSKINVLLLEFSERNVRGLLADTSYVNNLINAQSTGIKTDTNKIKAVSILQRIKNIRSGIFDFIFNNRINSNIESNFWDISLFTPIKEFKSNMNYKLFDKVDKNVKVSKDGKQLFYTPTIDTSNWMSSFKSLSEAEKDSLVIRLNKIFVKGKNLGFNKIYLSIIPNPVSIIDPNYNGLIYNDIVNRIQNDKNLKLPYIDIMPAFKVLKSKSYSPSDTHWSQYGADTWLNKFNSELSKITIESQAELKK